MSEQKQYDNEMRFTLFENDKGVNDKRPDRKGTLTMNGVEYTMSGWIKTDRTGKRFLSGQVEPKKERTPSAQTEPSAPKSPIEDEDIPF